MEINLTSCRACLCETEEMHYLFNEFDQGMTLQEIVTTTTKFEVDENDGLSPYFCQNCTNTVVEFYNLLTIYKENENQIKQLLRNVETNLQEAAVVKQGEEDEIAEEALPENEDKSDRADYITIKVESDEEFATQQQLKEELEDANCKDEVNEYGLTADEAANFALDDKNTQMDYEYQEINTFTCPECGDCFLYKNDIQIHMADKHNVTDINYEEVSEVSLLKVKKVDTKAPCANKCKICNQAFPTIEAYKEHLETHKKNTCHVCGVGFVKKAYLRDHLEIHSTEKKHVCNFCNKAFKRRTVLVKHKRIHTHPREYVCEICGKAFNDKGTLKTHIMLLHVKERNFICLICGVKFPLKATLEKHIHRRHQKKQREFFCTQCPLGYRDKSSLDRHIFVKHSGQNTKSTCNECGKQYVTVSSLLKHQRVAHASLESASVEVTCE